MFGFISAILHSGHSAGYPRPIVHFDNPTSHRSAMTENFFKAASFVRLPTVPDTSPYILFLFGGLQGKPKGEEFETMEELEEIFEEPSLARSVRKQCK
jgi:hypothetical protein